MKKKGQALVEFIIILPIFLMLMLTVFDIGRILADKITLESQASEVISLYQSGANINEINNKLQLENEKTILEIQEDEYANIYLTKKINIITPGLNLVLDNPFSLTVKRSVLKNV